MVNISHNNAYNICCKNDVKNLRLPIIASDSVYNSGFIPILTRHKLKSVVEEVLSLHFGEIKLEVILKSLQIGKYFDKIFGNMPLPQ